MAVYGPHVYYIQQRNQALEAELRQKVDMIDGLVQQEHRLRQDLVQMQREVEGLRAQLLEKDTRIQELEGQGRPRKRARAEPGEFTPRVRMNTGTPWSSLAARTIREKRAALRDNFLKPCFDKLPSNIVKANVTFRTDDGVKLEVEWPQGLHDRRGQLPPDPPVRGRGYRHQTDETRDLVRWCVHFKDQASVSDVWWHELHMKFKEMIPPISWLQEEKREQNSFIPYQLEENARDGNGASRSVAGIIKHHLMMPANQHLLQGDEPEVCFRYGIDGRPQAKNNIIGAVMACITPVRSVAEAQKRPRTVKEEYCVFLYSGKEDYQEQIQVGDRVFREMEALQQNGLYLDMPGGVQKHVKIKWYIVSDWKALAIMMGLVGPTGFELRSQETAQRCIGQTDNRGYKEHPVFNISWDNVIIDTLHLFLRIGGKLLNQLMGWTIDQGRTAALEKAMSDIGVSFWIRKEGTALGPSAYKWKTLTAKELKTAIRGLPLHMANIINDVGNNSQVCIDALQGPQATKALRNLGETVPRAISERKAKLKRLLGEDAMASVTLSNRDGQTEIRVADIIELWKDFPRITDMQRHPEQHAQYKEAATRWCERFRDITYSEDITPYIHYFGVHAGDQLAAHPFLHYVNCETIEKKNHVQTRRFHLATQKGGGHYKSKWAEQLMQMENRDTFAAMHGIGERTKRPWGQNRLQENSDSSDTGFSDTESDVKKLKCSSGSPTMYFMSGVQVSGLGDPDWLDQLHL
ncbi:hypothetical protein Bbelb_013060 [Branchiostoma belcheri]|nr:hypothetical protein Bbelb_013060 [Branchiostoma belcheri]